MALPAWAAQWVGKGLSTPQMVQMAMASRALSAGLVLTPSEYTALGAKPRYAQGATFRGDPAQRRA